jgi:hypothetical protein
MSELRIKELALCLSAVLAAGAGGTSHAESSGSTATSRVIHNVTSCLDNGAVGTLRQVVGIAASGDTVDLSGVPVSCSTISLTMGEIAIGQSSLTISGPTARTLEITNSQVGRILHHTGIGGMLAVGHLTLSNAIVYTTTNPAKGGCIYSSGDVSLYNATLGGCTAEAYAGVARGGAIFAAGNVQLSYSTVTGSAAYAYDDSSAAGGGIYALKGLFIFFSTISGNATFNRGVSSSGGGAYVSGGNVNIYYSTIDTNYAGFGGGIASASAGFVVRNSTISGNTATFSGGGIEITSLFVGVYNSTIAFNTAAGEGGGIYSRASVEAVSSIIANNRNKLAVPFADLYIQGAGHTLTGQNDLIVASNLALLGTVTSDPMLTPLATRGGATRTHGLSLNSPAIDNGTANPLDDSDQRGPGFSRAVPAGKADIGAYERQANDDELFYGSFD